MATCALVESTIARYYANHALSQRNYQFTLRLQLGREFLSIIVRFGVSTCHAQRFSEADFRAFVGVSR
jgi:hypothetical protein